MALIAIGTKAQELSANSDSLDYAIDSNYLEDKRNYVGANISPFFTSVIGASNKDIKISFLYKRNLGTKNLRSSFNVITQVNQFPYQSSQIIGVSDSSYTSRNYRNAYKTYDLRIGFEELKGYQFSRLHIGADFLVGLARYNNSYNETTLVLDSTMNFVPLSGVANNEGMMDIQYLTLGLDVSFGFDWFLSDDFLFTFQLTPQFNYFLPTSFNKTDTQDIYSTCLLYTSDAADD